MKEKRSILEEVWDTMGLLRLCVFQILKTATMDLNLFVSTEEQSRESHIIFERYTLGFEGMAVKHVNT